MARIILYRYVPLVCLLALFGCTGLQKIKTNGQTITGFNNIYVNDSLKISSTFWGIFVRIEKKRQVHYFLKVDGLHVPGKYCMALYRTDRPDTIIHDSRYYIFYFPDEKKGMKHLGLPVDFVEQVIFDSVKTEAIKFIYPERNGIIAMVGIDPKPYNDFRSLKVNFGDYVFKQIKTDAHYQEYPPDSLNQR